MICLGFIKGNTGGGGGNIQKQKHPKPETLGSVQPLGAQPLTLEFTVSPNMNLCR